MAVTAGTEAEPAITILKTLETTGGLCLTEQRQSQRVKDLTDMVATILCITKGLTSQGYTLSKEAALLLIMSPTITMTWTINTRKKAFEMMIEFGERGRSCSSRFLSLVYGFQK
eukprot:m.121028 g.121028  ORF g.121028 m.121028 type:complete len:114 (-) comp15514_c0_seq1:305-646(-)